MKKIYAILFFLLSIFSVSAEVSFFAVNLSGEAQSCVLRNEKKKFQAWGIENWENEETILLDGNLPAGEYFVWISDNDKWINTKQPVTLNDGKIYCFFALPNNVFKLEELTVVSDKADTAVYWIINRSGHKLKDVRFSSDFEKKTANYFDAANYETSLFPVKKGTWKIFWEYEDYPDNYFALPDNQNTRGDSVRKVEIENSNAYLFILLPEKADFMSLGTFIFPYK